MAAVCYSCHCCCCVCNCRSCRCSVSSSRECYRDGRCAYDSANITKDTGRRSRGPSGKWCNKATSASVKAYCMRFRRTAPTHCGPQRRNAHRCCVRDRRALEARRDSAAREQHATLRLHAALVRRSRRRNEKSAPPVATAVQGQRRRIAALVHAYDLSCVVMVMASTSVSQRARVCKRTWRMRALLRAWREVCCCNSPV